MHWLTELLQYPFMLNALLVGALVATVCAVLSCFLVLKGWSLMGDAISHAVLPGIVLAYILGLPLALGAFGSGLFCAVATGWIKNNSRIKEDTIMGVVFTGLFGLGLVLMTKVETELHLNHILFGNLLGITPDLIQQTVIIGGLTLAVILAKHRDLLLYCFDPAQARGCGLNTTALHYLLLVLLSLTIVAALQAVGIILVIAMLITPGCVAYLLTDRFQYMLVISVASALFSCVAGVYASFYLNGSTGACIVLVQALQFVLAMFFAPKHGILAKRAKIQMSQRLS
jgi:ABC-type Mn2+/Zn2+ transport system permease subunit